MGASYLLPKVDVVFEQKKVKTKREKTKVKTITPFNMAKSDETLKGPWEPTTCEAHKHWSCSWVAFEQEKMTCRILQAADRKGRREGMEEEREREGLCCRSACVKICSA